MHRNSAYLVLNKTLVAGRMMDPKDVHTWIPRTWEYGTSFGKRELTQLMTVTGGRFSSTQVGTF